MYEPDDRLVGDPVWELFPVPAPQASRGTILKRRWGRWLAATGLIAATWFLAPPLSVVLACLSFSYRDLANGRQLARAIPDKAGGRICALFASAWGLWKLGSVAFVSLFPITSVNSPGDPRPDMPLSFAVAMLLWLGGCTISAVFAVAGLAKAYRSGMRIWIGEGINQARMLLMGTLVVVFAYFVLVPLILWLATLFPQRGQVHTGSPWVLMCFFGCLFGIPLLIVLTLDGICRHVVADRPGKFGPKVPTVGKWNSASGWKDAGTPD